MVSTSARTSSVALASGAPGGCAHTPAMKIGPDRADTTRATTRTRREPRGTARCISVPGSRTAPTIIGALWAIGLKSSVVAVRRAPYRPKSRIASAFRIGDQASKTQQARPALALTLLGDIACASDGLPYRSRHYHPGDQLGARPSRL